MIDRNITGVGKELSKLEFTGFLDWLVYYQDPVNLFKAHTSFFFCEAVFLLGALLCVLHSLKQGGRWPYLFVAAVGQGFMVELTSYSLPDIDNFWQSQSGLMFFGRRYPLYIIFLYPVFYYQASWATSKLKLKCPYSEHLAVGLLTVLIDIPYDLIGAKYVHWVWHDTDPNIADRNYWVPWNSYYFHATFAFSWSFLFHKTRQWIDKRKLPKWEAGTLMSEIISVIVASIFGMPGGCLPFIIFYHPMHDLLGIPTEVTSMTLLIVFFVIVWKFDRNSNRMTKPDKPGFLSKALMVHLFLHFATFLLTVVFLNPEDQIAMGLHEPVGDCNEIVPVHTPLMILQKRKYFCASDYDEKYFDFHCVPNQKLPNDGSIWYTVCGTPFENRAEYILILSLISFVAYMIFRSIHFDYNYELVKLLSVSDDKKGQQSSSDKQKKKKIN